MPHRKGPGLRPRVECAAGSDVVVARPMRRLNSGVALIAQRFSLILDEADAAGNARYHCKIVDASAQGFGVMCDAVEQTPDLFQVGARMTLEAADRKRLRVEVRWIKKGRLGVKRLASDWA